MSPEILYQLTHEHDADTLSGEMNNDQYHYDGAISSPYVASFPSIRTIFLFHLISGYIMLGIVLITQVVTYPMYQLLPTDSISTYQSKYIIRAFILIGPIMLVELLTGIRMAIKVTDLSLHSLIRADIAILIAIWIITLAFELPMHINLLNNGFTIETYRSIMVGNIFRLFLWAIRCVIITKMIKFFYSYDTVYDYQELA